VLTAGGGESEARIASWLQINRKTVRLWRDRFAREGLQGLWEIAAGRGRKPTYGPDRIKAVIDTTLHSKPKGSTHWSCRTLAADQGMSKSTVNDILRGHNLKPHRTKTFKLSRAPRFLEKLTDVVGLYLNPPDKAIVLCVDEKSQIQALDRTQPGLPLKKGRCGTMTHDYPPRRRTGPLPCLPPSTCSREKSLATFTSGTAIRSFSASCAASTGTFLQRPLCT